MDDSERYEAGMKVRRAVLGDAHVERTLTKRNAFNEEYQNLITRYAWGEIWTRPGLPRHTRSLLTLAMMVALNRRTSSSCMCARHPTMASRASKSRRCCCKRQKVNSAVEEERRI